MIPIKKYKITFIVIILLQSWWLWKCRKDFVIDYAFISQINPIATGVILSVDVTTNEGIDAKSKVAEYDVFNYTYKFVIDAIQYINSESSLDVYSVENKNHTQRENIYIEYVIYQLEIKKQRISEIKTISVFYEEHFKLKKDIYIEYLKTNPKINRIEKFAEVKTKFDFFKKYFMYKLVTLIVVLLFLIYAENRTNED
jgi:hypothetical protein